MRSVVMGRGLRMLVAGTLSLGLGLVAITDSADARTPHRRAKVARVVPAYSPPFAALVVDLNTGKTLYSKNENDLRHPASVTKVMTLYMLFEQLERGKMTLESDIEMTAHAASMEPSKLGLRPGQKISVENAIKAVVTKSANDVAAAIADNIGGSEEHFAEMMTAKARALGMSRTVYVNASGLPDEEQVTTARDLVTLGRAIQERFPKYYAYFSTHNFRYGRANMANHNHLLGRVEGMDGIKTGYTRASGFNLLTSVKRRIVAVVLGGKSAGGRDKIMADLIEDTLDKASATRRAAPLVAERDGDDVPKAKPMMTARWDAPAAKNETSSPAPVVSAVPAKPIQLASMSSAPVALPSEKVRPAVISNTSSDQDTNSITASIGNVGRTSADGSTSAQNKSSGATTPIAGSNGLRWAPGQSASAPAASAQKAPTKAEVAAPVKPAGDIKLAKSEPAKAETLKSESQRPAAAKHGVMIQIGATDDQAKANDLLAKAKSKGKTALAAAQPFTEKVKVGGETLYRARFAGLEENQADAACKSLKRSGFQCFTTKQ